MFLVLSTDPWRSNAEIRKTEELRITGSNGMLLIGIMHEPLVTKPVPRVRIHADTYVPANNQITKEKKLIFEMTIEEAEDMAKGLLRSAATARELAAKENK